MIAQSYKQTLAKIYHRKVSPNDPLARVIDMKKPRHHRKKKKGIVGIEAAIVLIAFVIVAAALAFVVLNMGMFTTQKSKEVISRGLEESTSALQVAGTITAEVNNTVPKVDSVVIPVQVAPGREAVDLSANVTTIYLQTPENTYTNIHLGVWKLYYNGTAYILQWISNSGPAHIVNTTFVFTSPPSLRQIIEDLRIATTYAKISGTVGYIVLLNVPQNEDTTILKFGEKALVVVLLSPADQLSYYQQFTVELRPPVGAPLTISRSVPASLTPGTLIALS